jgi:hypothetical protein
LSGRQSGRRVLELAKPVKLKEVVEAFEYPETWQVYLNMSPFRPRVHEYVFHLHEVCDKVYRRNGGLPHGNFAGKRDG